MKINEQLETQKPVSADDYRQTRHYEIFWSVYFRCARRKVRSVHLPALDALIGEPFGPRKWKYVREDFHFLDEAKTIPETTKHRVVSVESTNSVWTDQIFLDLLKRLYAVRRHWKITAELDPTTERGVYVQAWSGLLEPGNSTPALLDVQVEIEAIPE